MPVLATVACGAGANARGANEATTAAAAATRRMAVILRIVMSSGARLESPSLGISYHLSA